MAYIDTASAPDVRMEPNDTEGFFEYGMFYSAGVGVTIDLIEAHKWYNRAAARGHGQAARLRREVAELMSDSEIGQAQRAARDWLKGHPQQPVHSMQIRAAA
jgi:TPR repeat protein